jgi:hypothetical protein
MDEPPEEERSREEMKLRSWQFDNLVRLGFDELAAARLVDAHVDWHEAEKLLEQGCSEERAVEILL